MAGPRQKLIVFTRIPEVGRNKTRLIPALGAEGASAFHERLARHAIGRASGFAVCHPGTELEIRVTGGSTVDGRAWLGGGEWKIQSDGDLGERLNVAVEEAFESGDDRLVLLGTDCPRLDETRLGEAFDALNRSDVVIGPALDGGYYLIGLKKSEPELFKGILWGGPEVFAQTMERVSKCGLSSTVLGELSDVDMPEDIAEGERALLEGSRVSVIVPTLNEAELLAGTLDRVNGGSPWEVLVADGGSSDETRDIASRMGARVVEGACGRAAQMNLAAASATGEYLFFLHADTVPPEGYQELLIRTLNRPRVAGGAFGLGIDCEIGAAGLIEKLVDLRCRWFGPPYGDQGLFVRRALFDRVGGFPEIRIMEDFRMVGRLKRLGMVVVAREQVRSSGRRWRSGGLIRTFLKHQLMLLAHHIGVPPNVISKFR